MYSVCSVDIKQMLRCVTKPTPKVMVLHVMMPIGTTRYATSYPGTLLAVMPAGTLRKNYEL